MQVETFKVYCDLIETASFSNAAKLNGVTQSAVSQQVRALEKRFEVVLVERGKKNFSVTPEGKIFLEAARDILEVYNSIGDRIHDLQNKVVGQLRVATVFSLGLHELPPFIKRYRKAFPDVEVTVDYLRSSQVYHEVTEGTADIGIVAYPAKRKGIAIEEFATDRLVCICPPEHRFGERKTLKLSDLDGEKFISFEPDLPTRKALDKEMKEAGVKVKREMEFDNIETVKRAVEIENGISIVPENSVEGEVKAGTLRAIPLRSPTLIRPLGLVQKRTRATSPAMREFIATLKGVR
jgi:DNA-binding transcriptional LysR family regulator